jgi:hypothetical protein
MSVVTLDRVVVEGHTRRGFEIVREAFADEFTQRGELDGACCACYQGAKVVDLWLTGDPRDVAVSDAL